MPHSRHHNLFVIFFFFFAFSWFSKFRPGNTSNASNSKMNVPCCWSSETISESDPIDGSEKWSCDFAIPFYFFLWHWICYHVHVIDYWILIWFWCTELPASNYTRRGKQPCCGKCTLYFYINNWTFFFKYFVSPW